MGKSPKKQINKQQDVNSLISQYHKSVTQSVNGLSNSAFNFICTLYGNILLYLDNNKLLFPVRAIVVLRKFTKEIINKKIYKNFTNEQQEVFVDILLFIFSFYSFNGCRRLIEDIASDIVDNKEISLAIRLVVSAKLIEAKIHLSKNFKLDEEKLMVKIRSPHIRINLGHDFEDTLIKVFQLTNNKEVLNIIKSD